MATLYVRSTDGNNTDNGSTWALAKATLAGAAAIDAAGDTIYVSDNHAESNGASQSIALAGTLASPVKVICADDAAEPPTASATTATCTTTGAFGFTITGTAYFYGIRFDAGTGTSGNSNAGDIGINRGSQTGWQLYENCAFVLNINNANQDIKIGPTGDNVATQTVWKNCDVRFANVGQEIVVSRGPFVWNGGSLLSGGTSPTTLFSYTSSFVSTVEVSGVNLTNAGQSINIFTAGTVGKRVIRNCRLPANWNGSLATGTFVSGERCEMYNCDSGDTNYRIWIEDYAGDLYQETVIVRSGGATDGTTPISWRLVSTANAEFPLPTFDAPEIVRWNDTTGSSITVTVEIITDNVTLKDDEIWLEVQYLGTSGFPLSTFISDCKADPIPAGQNQDTSSVTWTTTGLTTPTKQKLSVTFTPQEKGFIHAVVKLAKASTTVYVDPKLTVT